MPTMLNMASTSGRACLGASQPRPPALILRGRGCRRARTAAVAAAATTPEAAAAAVAALAPSSPTDATDALILPLSQALADLADVTATATTTTTTTTTNDGGWLAPLTNTLEATLRALQSLLDAAHVPDSYGWSIVLLTLVVKTAVLPLTKKQVESSMAVQSLKPRIDLIKARYEGDKERVSAETSKLYKAAGVNPAAGCLPSLASIPVFIGLYRSLSKASEEGLFAGQGWLWIPSLSGPVSMAANRAGGGTAWLWPLDPTTNAPPIGWHDALCYLSLPVLLVIAQAVSNKVISPPIDPKQEGANTARALNVALPLMVGWFALNVPSGLGIYYLSNTLVTMGQQVWLRKLGGADVKVNDLGPVTKPGTGRRLGPAFAAGANADEWRAPAKLMAAAASVDSAAAEQAAAGPMDPEAAKAERQRLQEEERRLQLERRLVKRAKQTKAPVAVGAGRA
jgi:YidC/Oxa1 family membrane protein insertase